MKIETPPRTHTLTFTYQNKLLAEEVCCQGDEEDGCSGKDLHELLMHAEAHEEHSHDGTGSLPKLGSEEEVQDA